MKTHIKSPSTPLKFSPLWLEEEDFISLVKKTWKHLDSSYIASLMSQFAENLLEVKRAIKKWIKVHKARTLRQVKETEETLAALYLKLDDGPLTNSQLFDLKELETTILSSSIIM